MLSEEDKRVCGIFADKNMERDTFIGLTSILSKKNAFKEMLTWLEENKQADIDEIREKVLDIYDREELKKSK